MAHITKKTVLETIGTAKDYSTKLEELIASVKEAESQISTTSEKAAEDIDSKFDLLYKSLTEALASRRSLLKSQVQEIEKKGLLPLEECRNEISNKLKNTKLFINDLEDVLKVGGLSPEKTCMFLEQSSALGSLPAVPDLEIVPEITLQCSAEPLLADMLGQIGRLGKVSKMGPVQITSIEEKPGALFVSWEEVDLELNDVQLYRLQMAHDDVRDNELLIERNFHDVYSGPELCCLVRGLSCRACYSFRVCCRADADAPWSAWSLLKVAATRVEPFGWDITHPDYSVSNGGKLATKNTAETSILFSERPQIAHGCSTEFTLVDTPGECLSEEGVALTTWRGPAPSLAEPGTLFCSLEGKVYIDGLPKLTSLPRLEKGAKLTFSCENLTPEKLRVNLDSGSKAVTYDWRVPVELQPLHFAALLVQPGLKLLVE